MEDSKTCECQMCSCPTVEDSDYCSDHCRDICEQGLTEIKCDCGHAGCA